MGAIGPITPSDQISPNLEDTHRGKVEFLGSRRRLSSTFGGFSALDHHRAPEKRHPLFPLAASGGICKRRRWNGLKGRRLKEKDRALLPFSAVFQPTFFDLHRLERRNGLEPCSVREHSASHATSSVARPPRPLCGRRRRSRLFLRKPSKARGTFYPVWPSSATLLSFSREAVCVSTLRTLKGTGN